MMHYEESLQKLVEELKIRKYSNKTIKKYADTRWHDIDFRKQVIHIRKAKGNNDRIIFLHKNLQTTQIYTPVSKRDITQLANLL